MIYLFTGTPGTGKTLNAINFVLTDSRFNAQDEVIDDDGKKTMVDRIVDGQIVKRPVYYFNIEDVQHPWNELSLEDVKKWFDLPDGSIIFIDECQDVFSGVPRNVPTPPLYSRLNKHRHQGMDIVLVTQGGSLIPSFMRPLINRHFHLENESGANGCKFLERGKFIDNPDRKVNREACEIYVKPYPKHLYGTYKSSVLHTKKFKMPKVFIKLAVYACLLIFVVVGGGLYLYSLKPDVVSDDVETEVKPSSKASPNNSKKAFASKKSDEYKSLLPLDPVEYLKVLTPRIEGIPHTAPLFDSFIASPKAAPKTICYGYQRNGKYRCKCVTEQNTSLIVPHNSCVNIVKNGMYDVTLAQ